jgi:hypothetical protein
MFGFLLRSRILRSDTAFSLILYFVVLLYCNDIFLWNSYFQGNTTVVQAQLDTDKANQIKQ